MKEKNKFLLLKILVPVLIIGGCAGINKLFNVKAQNLSQKPIVVCEDSSSLPKIDDKPLEIVSKKSYGNVVGVSENFGFIGDDEIVVGIGMSSDEFLRKYPKGISKGSDEEFKAWNDMRGSLYKLKLSTSEKIPLNIATRDRLSDISPNGSKLNYVKGNKLFIYDLKNDSSTEYRTVSSKLEGLKETANWSQDGNCLISYTDSGDLRIYNVKKNSTKEVKVKKEDLWISSIPSFYSEDGENVYFIGEQSKGKDLRYQRQGVFKINSSSGKIEDIFTLPYNDTQRNNNNSSSGIPSSNYSVLDGGKRILFNASIEGKDGAYIYDVDSKKFYNVVPHTVKAKEGSYGSPTFVSPDETKVVYMNLAFENNKEQWNLYAAKINGNTFTSRVCLAKDVKTAGSFDSCVKWSSDSKKVLFFNIKELVNKNSFTFMDKNELNIVTFK